MAYHHILVSLVFSFSISLLGRQKEDLLMKMDLLMSEALCGFKRVVKTLDDRDIVITSHPGINQ